MTQDQRQQNEIDALEQWLGAQLPPEDPANVEHLKLRVRIELGETWLEKQIDPAGDNVDPGLADQVRGALPGTARFGSGNARKAWVAAGLGLAALLAISILNSQTIPVSTGESTVVEANEDPWLNSIEDPVDEDLDEIEDEISELSELLAMSESDWSDDTDF